VQREIPKYTSIERIVKARSGKMYIDFLQNRPQATVAAPYSLRPKPGATVSMPLHWDEVKKGLKMSDFTIYNAIKRIKNEGYIFKPVLGKGINLEKVIKKAKAKLKAIADKFICDALLEQDIFAGVGNIIKNEILYRVRLHPESIVRKIPTAIINKLIDQTRIYSFQFLDWKRKFELKKHWLAHTKKICLRCNLNIIRKQTGLKKRRSFICANCQLLYN
jgi:hypothetical protein